MQSRDVEYCTFREIRAVIMTWNAGASTPGSVRGTKFIEDAIGPENPPEIVVFGFQELVDLENKKITASSFLYSVYDQVTNRLRRDVAAREQEERRRRKGAYESAVSGVD